MGLIALKQGEFKRRMLNHQAKKKLTTKASAYVYSEYTQDRYTKFLRNQRRTL